MSSFSKNVKELPTFKGSEAQNLRICTVFYLIEVRIGWLSCQYNSQGVLLVQDVSGRLDFSSPRVVSATCTHKLQATGGLPFLVSRCLVESAVIIDVTIPTIIHPCRLTL